MIFHFESTFENVTGKKQSRSLGSDFLPLIPANNWNNTLRAEFNIKNWLKDGFATFNVSNTFNIHLNGNNLLNKSYIAHLSRLKTDGIQNIGRNIILGINFNI